VLYGAGSVRSLDWGEKRQGQGARGHDPLGTQVPRILDSPDKLFQHMLDVAPGSYLITEMRDQGAGGLIAVDDGSEERAWLE